GPAAGPGAFGAARVVPGQTGRAMAPVKRVLLLNPPWPFPILRDAWCTSVSKAGYLWQPVDLLAQTGWLARHGIAYRAIDAIAERLSPAACLRRAEDWDPDLV